MANRGLARTVGNIVLQSLTYVPNLFLQRGAAGAAASVTGDPQEHLMGDRDASLHAPAGATCSRCGALFRGTDPVRATSTGTVHEVCPA